jgi:streptogramin lyase
MIEPELIGIPIRAVDYGNNHGAMAPSPSGRPGMFYISYYATTGCELLGYHSASGEMVKVAIPSQGVNGMCLGPDGALYLGGVSPGNLYRYDPASGQLRALGGPEFGVEYIWDCDTTSDGRVYGACWPGCNVIEYDTRTGKLRDLGNLVQGEKYARSLCVDHRDRVWVGCGMRAHLFVIDPQSRDRRNVLPEMYADRANCHNVALNGSVVTVTIEHDGDMLIFDADSEELTGVVTCPEGAAWLTNTIGARPGEAYFHGFPNGDLYRYQIAERRLTTLAEGLGICDRVVDGRYVHGIFDQDYFLYDLQERRYVDRRSPLTQARDGMRIQTLTGAPNGSIYGSTYINQHLFCYDPGVAQLSDLGRVMPLGGQVDSIRSGPDGRIYMGSYVMATLSVYDPAKPWTPGRSPEHNPRELGSVEGGQYRTKTVIPGPDGTIWVGSIPDYNSGPTGAFTRWYEETGEHRNWHDLVPGGAVHHVVTDGRYLYCGGGGRFFVWDPDTLTKCVEIECLVSALALTSDGWIAGSGDGSVFVFDPAAMGIVDRFASPVGALKAMTVTHDGSLYGINDGAIVRVDVTGRTIDTLTAEGGQHLAADGNGDLYFARGAELFRLRVGN